MNKILTHGHCSARYKWPTWPNFLSTYITDATIINLAKPGIGNETIARDVVNAVSKFSDLSHMYIMWGAPHRYDLFTEGKQEISNDKDSWSMYDNDFDWTVTYNGNYNAQPHPVFDRLRTLENILYTQLVLDKNKINYTMMIYDIRTLPEDVACTKPEIDLKKQIDWNKFLFYKDKFGLRDFAHELYPSQFPAKDITKGDRHLHPLPYAHYKWVKDIMFKSKSSIENESKYKTWEIEDAHWMTEAKQQIPYETKNA